MSQADQHSWFVLATVVSMLLGFLLSVSETSQRFGSEYRKTILDAWLKVFQALFPLGIYCVVSLVRGGWEQIFQSPELSAVALTILLMSCHELSLGLAVVHKFPIKPERLSIVAGWSLFWLIASTISVVLVYQASPVPAAAIAWQIILLAIAVLTYFASAVPVRLLRAGYTPRMSALGSKEIQPPAAPKV
ncbi:hypothetical protein [Silanimonas sp.]|jgi:hypothetical protein|uniref:hypothetical protein n=1 Tax=Silanimonas sp. TaxID=1929290 RepID=UPI0037CB7497